MGGPGGWLLCSGSTGPAERQKQNQRWLWVGRMLSTLVKARSQREGEREGEREGTASDCPEEAVRALSGKTPACLRFS